MVSWDAPGRPGVYFTEKWLSSAINISPGLLTDAFRMLILDTGAVKLPENLSLSRFQEAGSFLHGPGSMSGRRIRKEKNGLDVGTTDTCQMGIDPDRSVFPYCSHLITPPNSQTPQ